ncbi:MAG TPA: bifunctional glutamate N-acetyltransferase/amino-acid acetyltransferase ArgJ [Microthrixaceae bacterium]|nr:bifunctional glutamate N-acetyltransferase/amino-acid acetyltransferase ArgJ [Microthrixaceae bacterium]
MTDLDPAGFRAHVANVGIKDDSLDFAVVASEEPCAAAAVFTRSRFAGPSVTLSREVAANGSARAIVVVSKNANVATGPGGLNDARDLQVAVAGVVGVAPDEVFVCSTGVIGRRYPTGRIDAHLNGISWATAADAELADVARAIMTTDTRAKVSRRSVGDATLVGIAKGVGMIEPDMATLLTFFFTDAEIGSVALDSMFHRVVDRSFNALSIDTDTSTSDSAIVLASGAAGPVDPAAFEEALGEVALELVRQIAGDGEGATKVIETTVTGARDDAQAKRVAKAIVNSPLVKTAVHGADPNWGRVAMAIGKCQDDTDIDQEQVTICIGGVEMYPSLADEERLAEASRHLDGATAVIAVDLGIGDGRFTAFGCDLTDGYVRINADYTT